MNAMTDKANENMLATRMNGAATGLVKAALAMPLACKPEQVTSVETALPRLFEFEQQEEARRIREEEERLQREREAKRIARD